jgi:hypothetical protein
MVFYTCEQIRNAAKGRHWTRPRGGLNKDDILNMLDQTIGGMLTYYCDPKYCTSNRAREILVLYLDRCLFACASDEPMQPDVWPRIPASYDYLPLPEDIDDCDSNQERFEYCYKDLFSRRTRAELEFTNTGLSRCSWERPPAGHYWH